MRLFTTTLLAVLLVGLTGCITVRDVPDSVEGARITLVVTDLSSGATVAMVQAVQERAAELGMTVEAVTGDGDDERQRDLIAQALDDDVDGLIVEPAAMMGFGDVFSTAQEAGVAVVLVGAPHAASEQADAVVGPDAAEQGRLQMTQVVEAFGDDAVIAILSTTNRTIPQRATQAGYDEVLADHPGVEVVAVQPANGSPSQATTLVSGWLRTHPDLDAVVAMDDAMALGALTAIRDAGRDGDVAAYGMGATDQMLSALLDGAPGGTLWTDPWELGRAAADAVVPVILETRDTGDVTVPSEWVDADNVHEYLNE